MRVRHILRGPQCGLEHPCVGRTRREPAQVYVLAARRLRRAEYGAHVFRRAKIVEHKVERPHRCRKRVRLPDRCRRRAREFYAGAIAGAAAAAARGVRRQSARVRIASRSPQSWLRNHSRRAARCSRSWWATVCAVWYARC
eukprot:2758022-Prymnesium_polylepis.1